MLSRRTLGLLVGGLSLCTLPFVATAYGLSSSSPTPVVQGPDSHEVKLTVSTTGSPFDDSYWSGGPAHIGVLFRYYDPEFFIVRTVSVWVEFTVGQTPCEYATQLAQAIDAHVTLQHYGFETEVVNNTVFVTGPECEHCPGTIDQPEIYGDKNRIQVIQNTKEK